MRPRSASLRLIADNSSNLPTFEDTAITIPQGFCVTNEQFEQLVDTEQLARLELTKSGELIVMSPTGGTAGRKNSRLIQRLRNWADLDRTGEVFDSSTVFILPSGARRSPDASWIRLERWNQLTPKQQDGFPPIAPDFVIELVSPSDLRCDPALCGAVSFRAPIGVYPAPCSGQTPVPSSRGTRPTDWLGNARGCRNI